MNMEVWNLVRLKQQLDNMREHKRLTTEEHVIYVLNPFIASLGYDIYDVAQVDVQVAKGRVVVRPVPNVNVVFSVTSPTPSNAKVFVHFDTKKYQMKVYMYAMHKWEVVDVVDLSDVTEPNSSVYSSVLRVIAQEAFQIMYAEREERMFTERILRSKLEAGTMNNDFTVAALKRLFDNPTEAFLSAIAEVLAQDYSTDDSNELYGLLQPMHTQGIRGIVSEYMKDIPMTADKPNPSGVHMQHSTPAPAYVEPVRVQPAYAEPVKVQPAYVEPAYVEPVKVEPAYTEPAHVAPAVVAPAPQTQEKLVEVEKDVVIAVETEEDKKADTHMSDLLKAVNKSQPSVVESTKKPKGEVNMDEVLVKKPAGNNIADMFSGESGNARRVPRTKPL